MPQVSSAAAADDLRPLPVRVRLAADSPFHFIIKTGPAASGFEFIHRVIQQGITLFAMVAAPFEKVIVFTRERSFRSLVKDHIFFLRG